MLLIKPVLKIKDFGSFSPDPEKSEGVRFYLVEPSKEHLKLSGTDTKEAADVVEVMRTSGERWQAFVERALEALNNYLGDSAYTLTGHPSVIQALKRD